MLDWFEPSLTSGNDLPWLSDYSEFVSELYSHFGPFDPEGEAEAELENLRMCDNQRITKYLVEFNRLAARVQWGNNKGQTRPNPPAQNAANKKGNSRDKTPIWATPTHLELQSHLPI